MDEVVSEEVVEFKRFKGSKVFIPVWWCWVCWVGEIEVEDGVEVLSCSIMGVWADG